jgi:hypothetical protein
MKFNQAMGPLQVMEFARTKKLHTIEPINSEMPKTENMNRVYKLSKKKHSDKFDSKIVPDLLKVFAYF